GGRVRDLLRRGADHQLHVGDDADPAAVRPVTAAPHDRPVGERGRDDPVARAVARRCDHVALAADAGVPLGGGSARRGTGTGGMSTTGAVSIRGVSKRFGSTLALQTLDLEIPPGSFFSL